MWVIFGDSGVVQQMAGTQVVDAPASLVIRIGVVHHVVDLRIDGIPEFGFA
jgi:hypothetical protein